MVYDSSKMLMYCLQGITDRAEIKRITSMFKDKRRSKDVDGTRRINKFNGRVSIRHNGKWIPEHRFIWEQAHGPIPRGNIVIPKNGITGDNRLENLISMPRNQYNSFAPPESELAQKRIRELEKIVKEQDELIAEYEKIICSKT